VEAEAAENYVWRSDDSVEVDFDADSEDEEREVTTSTGQYAAMATRQPLQLWLFQDMLGMDKLRNF